MTKTILPEDVIKQFDEKKFGFLTHTRVSESKQIEKKAYKHLRNTCMSCGLVEWIRLDEEEFVFSYELKLIEDTCQTAGIHNSIFKKLALETFNRKNSIFTITDGQLLINKKFPGFPILTIKYDNFEAMLLDMISAANYIKKQLEKNCNN